MSQYIVYADILMALNFFCDFFILWVTGRLLRRKISLPRCILGAALGALYGLTAVFPPLMWLAHPFCMIVFSLLLLRAAYQWNSPKSFIKLAGTFYLVSFTLAGAALTGQRLMENNGINLGPMQTMKIGSLLFALFIGILLAKKGWRILKKTWHKEDFSLHITIRAAGRSCRLPALLDTGNDLEEPLSGLPVAVAEYSALRPLFPEYMRRIMENCGETNPAGALKQLSENNTEPLCRKMRLVPYSSIGQSNGLLLGFRPDELILEGISARITDQAMIGITFSSLGEGFRAVINPELMEGGERYRKGSCA